MGFSGKKRADWKGMWAIPDKMSEMIKQNRASKIPEQIVHGVPSPTAATLHSTHYHKINVFNKQKIWHQGKKHRLIIY